MLCEHYIDCEYLKNYGYCLKEIGKECIGSYDNAGMSDKIAMYLLRSLRNVVGREYRDAIDVALDRLSEVVK